MTYQGRSEVSGEVGNGKDKSLYFSQNKEIGLIGL